MGSKYRRYFLVLLAPLSLIVMANGIQATELPVPTNCWNHTNYITADNSMFSEARVLYGVESFANLTLDGSEYHNDSEKSYRVYQTCLNGWIVQFADNPNAKILFAPKPN